mmetsp:Transcript_113325/g.325815  ORF Transcript_113325/g.325815 Transcript_113325/m.325815 type:complete len:315 (-) Transcript_113325:213-1157(-)
MHEKEGDVEKEEEGKGNTWEQESSDNSAELPETSLESLVETAGDVSRDNSRQHVKDQNGIHERSSASGTQETNGGKENDKENGDSELDTTSDANAIHHGHGGGWTEDIGMDQLPSTLVHIFILFFIGKSCEGIVGCNISAKIANQDGNDEKTQKEDYQDRVGDGIPVNLCGHQVIFGEIDIPSRGPSDITLLPDNVVGEQDLGIGFDNLVLGNARTGHVNVRIAGGQRLGHTFLAFSVPLVTSLELMSDTHWLNSKGDNTVRLHLRIGLVVVDNDVDVVENVGKLGLLVKKADWESSGIVQLSFSSVLPQSHRR